MTDAPLHFGQTFGQHYTILCRSGEYRPHGIFTVDQDRVTCPDCLTILETLLQGVRKKMTTQ